MPVYAVGIAQLKMPELENLIEVPEPVQSGCEMQVWAYTPLFASDTETRNVVDPLSLSLSLQESADERVQLALDELQEHFPW
jgi:hypothetical protein